MAIKNTYIYANSQLIAQHDGDHTAGRYFYLHDRLGSVRQTINTSAGVVKYYTYEPFGETIEQGGTFDNPFRFTGQFFDSEIDEYYLRARQYNPHISRFTTRDPVFGRFREPLTLHVYLYCLNDPVNRIDPTGDISGMPTWAKLQAKVASYGLSARLGVDRFVTTLNLRAAWMDFKLSMVDLRNLGMEGMIKAHTLFAEVAWYGNRAIIAVSEYVAHRSNLQTLEEQKSFIDGLIGADPALPSDWAGGMGSAIHAVGEELYKDLEENSE